jgi:NADPH-dependent 2,4-dienoyl-CoA reductase/sulfur reductase-like enzyme
VHNVELADGQRVGYDALLLATGSTPRPLDVPGAYLDGVLKLRTLTDSDRIAAALVDGAKVVLVGGFWIGLEVAAVARQRGCTVTVLERSELPLLRVLGRDIAQVFADRTATTGLPSASAPGCGSSKATAGSPRSPCRMAPNCAPTWSWSA